jgi:hypothetical protein
MLGEILHQDVPNSLRYPDAIRGYGVNQPRHPDVSTLEKACFDPKLGRPWPLYVVTGPASDDYPGTVLSVSWDKKTALDVFRKNRANADIYECVPGETPVPLHPTPSVFAVKANNIEQVKISSPEQFVKACEDFHERYRRDGSELSFYAGGLRTYPADPTAQRPDRAEIWVPHRSLKPGEKQPIFKLWMETVDWKMD